MCKTQLNLTIRSLNFKSLIATAESSSLLCSKQIENNKKHNSHKNGTTNSILILCKIIKSPLCQNTPVLIWSRTKCDFSNMHKVSAGQIIKLLSSFVLAKKIS